jgi:sulfur-oxidizing protein SoxX
MRLVPLLLLAVTAGASGEPSGRDIEKIMQRDFHPRGQATMDRVVQDGVQRVCTESANRPPAELARALEADEMKSIAFPEGSLIGDWQRGEAIAQSGRGMTWNDKPGQAAGGSCYNCHQLSPQELSYGTIGPSLRGFGKTRGNGPDVQRYVYGKIYNAKAYNLCSQMPRLGASGTLTSQQIKDLVGLLLDPASPVNE